MNCGLARGCFALSCGVCLSCNPSPHPLSAPSPAQDQLKPAVATNPTTSADSASPAAGAPAPDPRPPPLESPDPFAFISVRGFGDAVVSLPLGTREKRPIVLATHGNYDTPEWQCRVWRDIIENDAFVLCPRGVERSDSPSRMDIRYQYASNQLLEKEIDAAVEALRLTYPVYVDDGSMLYTGFSQGAIMGASIMVRHPGRYPYAVLIEGGNQAWYAANAKKFAEGGGKRMLFACGQWGCKLQSENAQRALAKLGVESRVLFSKGQGHSYGGAVSTDIAAVFNWLIQDDPRWNHRRERTAKTAD